VGERGIKVTSADYESLYKSLFDNNRDAIIFFNKTEIVNANQSALDLFEETYENLIGKHIYDYTKKKTEALKRAESRVNGKPEFFNTEIHVKSGEKVLEVSATPVQFKDITSYTIVRDVTERNKTEQRYRNIFDHSADMIVVTNDSGVVFINPSGVKYLGLESQDEILGKREENIIHPDYVGLTTKYAEERRAGEEAPNVYRVKIIKKDGTIRDVELNASFILWDGVPSSLVMVRDIGEQFEYDKKLEALHRYASMLEQINTVEELAQSFVEAARDILNYDRVNFNHIEGGYSHILASNPVLKIGKGPLNGRGITVRAARTKKPQLIQDVTLDPDYYDVPSFADSPTMSEYAVPIIVKGETRAVLNIERANKNAFTENDQKLITTMADHIASTLNRLHYQQRLEALYKYGAEIGKSTTILKVAEITWNVIQRIFDAPIGSVGIVEGEHIHHIIGGRVDAKPQRTRGLRKGDKGEEIPANL